MKGFGKGEYALKNVTLKDVTFINATEEKALQMENYENVTLQNLKYEIRL
jgi:hypothetical protein